MRIHTLTATLATSLTFCACGASKDSSPASDAGRMGVVDESKPARDAALPDASLPEASLTDAGDACGDPRGRDSTCHVYLIRATPVADEPCTFSLDSQIPDPSYVFIQLDADWIKSKDGFQITEAGRELVLTKAACERYLEPGEHVLTVQVTCVCVERLS